MNTCRNCNHTLSSQWICPYCLTPYWVGEYLYETFLVIGIIITIIFTISINMILSNWQSPLPLLSSNLLNTPTFIPTQNLSTTEELFDIEQAVIAQAITEEQITRWTDTPIATHTPKLTSTPTPSPTQFPATFTPTQNLTATYVQQETASALVTQRWIAAWTDTPLPTRTPTPLQTTMVAITISQATSTSQSSNEFSSEDNNLYISPLSNSNLAQGLNIREGDSKNFEIAGVLYQGERALVLGQSSRQNGWIIIQKENDSTIEGWVNSQHTNLPTNALFHITEVSPPFEVITPTDEPIATIYTNVCSDFYISHPTVEGKFHKDRLVAIAWSSIPNVNSYRVIVSDSSGIRTMFNRSFNSNTYRTEVNLVLENFYTFTFTVYAYLSDGTTCQATVTTSHW